MTMPRGPLDLYRSKNASAMNSPNTRIDGSRISSVPRAASYPITACRWPLVASTVFSVNGTPRSTSATALSQVARNSRQDVPVRLGPRPLAVGGRAVVADLLGDRQMLGRHPPEPR
jgi:hypothetical protein